MKNSLDNYQNAIFSQFSFLKDTSRLDDLYTKSISLPNDLGYLLPICNLHADDSELIKKLAAWRHADAWVYPTQFPVTIEGTARWLQNGVLNTKDRITFLVVSKHGEFVGHLGFANALNDHYTLEIDNVVRGVKEGNPGIMQAAMLRMLQWAEEMLLPQEIFLRVFQDNAKAVAFYKKINFVEDTVIPLHRHQENDVIMYKPAKSGESEDKQFLRMRYAPPAIESVNELISTAGPSISAREVSYTNDAVRYGWNSQWNSYIKRFENTFSEYLGVKHALSTSSCTGALHIALAALDIGPGDEVIVPDITWVATANAVVYVGATPVFADVDMKTWCLDPASFERCITNKTKAVIPVHVYGHPAPIDKIVEIARRHKLYIVEDAAPAIGAEWKGQKVGTFGDFAAFSFQGAKLLVTGEGGMLVTNNDDLHQKAYALWDQGREPGTFWIKQNGVKYKMSNVQAAIGLGQIERADTLIEAKRRIFSWYEKHIGDLPQIQLNHEAGDAYSIYWMTSILLQKDAPVSQEELCKILKQNKIDTRPVYPAISQYPHWPRKQASQPNALHIGQNAINLPSGVCLQERQIEYICRTLRSILA